MKRQIILYSLYMFLYSALLTMMNMGSTGLISPELQQGMYYVDMGAVAIGFLLCALHGSKKITLLVLISSIVCAVFSLLVIFAPGEGIYIYLAPLSALSLGFVGGVVYSDLAEALKGSALRGRAIGIGGAAAISVQFILQIAIPSGIILPVILAAGFIMIPVIRRKLKAFTAEDTVPYGDSASELNSSSDMQVSTASMLRLTAITASMIIIISFTDSLMEYLQITSAFSSISVYSWPRWLLVPVYLIFGYIMDRRGESTVSLTALCMSFLAVLNLLLIKDGHMTVAICLYYILAGSFISFYNQMFISAAPRTNNPMLWSSMGRITDGLAGAVFGLLPFSGISEIAASGICAVLCSVILLLMIQNGYFSFGHNQVPVIQSDSQGNNDMASELREPLSPANDEEHFKSFAEEYKLSPRECDIFKLIISSEDKNSVLAKQLGISERMVYRHVRSIYDKTGTPPVPVL